MKKPSNLKMLLTICSLIACFSFLISSHAQAQLPMPAFSSVMYFTPPAPGTIPMSTTGLPTTFMPTLPTYGGLGTPTWGGFGFLKPTVPTYGGLGTPTWGGLGVMPTIPSYGGWLGTPPTMTGLTGWFGKATISPTTAPIPGLMLPGLMTFIPPIPSTPTGTSSFVPTPFGFMTVPLTMPSLGGFAAIMPFVPPLPIAPVVSTVAAPVLVAPTLIAPPVVAPTLVAPTLIAPPVVAPTLVAPTLIAPPVVAPTLVAPTPLV